MSPLVKEKEMEKEDEIKNIELESNSESNTSIIPLNLLDFKKEFYFSMPELPDNLLKECFELK